ncbi:Protein disulfide-isomerase A6 [Balamuthia mandrillaris]
MKAVRSGAGLVVVLLLCLASLSVSLLARAAESAVEGGGAKGRVEVLTSANFTEHVSDGTWLVKFFVPWCGHCNAMAGSWRELAASANEHGFRVAEVDCTAAEDVCALMSIEGYPTIFYFNGKKADDNSFALHKRAKEVLVSERTADEFISWVERFHHRAEVKKDDDSVYVLTAENFDEAISDGFWLVEFYAPWCPYCQKLAPTWAELGAQENVKDNFKVGKVNCDENEELCHKQQIGGFPSIRLFRDGTLLKKYVGEKEVDAFVEFVEMEKEAFVPGSDVLVLTNRNFMNNILSSDGAWMVEFYAPWCGHCKELAPEWESLASSVKNSGDDVKVAKVDCDANEELCNNVGVNSFPTIKMFQVTSYDGDRDVDSFIAFIRSQASLPAPTASDVITLTPDNFDSIKEGVWMVEFYAPWCSHCKALAPEWEAFATSSKGNLNVASVNCEAFPDLCDHVASFPTILLYANGGEPILFKGNRERGAFSTFAEMMAEEQGEDSDSHIIHLDSDIAIRDALVEGDWMIDFYVPWCSHCAILKPVWEDFALELHEEGIPVKAATFNCDDFYGRCKEIGVEHYPAIMHVRNGRYQFYDGSFAVEPLLEFAKKDPAPVAPPPAVSSTPNTKDEL